MMHLTNAIREFKRSLRERRAHWLHAHLYDDVLNSSRLLALADRFAGRSVAIVGNAESIFEREDGSIIDQCDLVVRINRGFIRHATSQGSRTDLVCIATKIEMREFRREFDGTQIVFVSPTRSNMSNSMMALGDKLICYPLSATARMMELTGGSRPSAGLAAIDVAHNFLSVGSIRLFGFDWKATKTFYRPGLKLGSHAWEVERALIQQWAAEGWLRLPPSG